MNKKQDYYSSIEYKIQQQKRNETQEFLKYIEKLEKEAIKTELID